MNVRLSAAVKVSIACGFAMFLAMVLVMFLMGAIFKAPPPPPDPAMPTPTPVGDDGFGALFAMGIGPLLAAVPIVAVGGVAAARMKRQSLSSIKGSLNLAMLTAVMSYVSWVAISVIGSLLIAVVRFQDGIGLLFGLLIFLWLGIFTMIVPVLVLFGIMASVIAVFAYSTYVLKLS